MREQVARNLRRCWPLFWAQWGRSMMVGLGIGWLAGMAILRWGPAEFTATILVAPLGRETLAITTPAGSGGRLLGLGWMESESSEENPSAFRRYIHFLTSRVSAIRILAEPGLVARLLSETAGANQERDPPPVGVMGLIKEGITVLSGREFGDPRDLSLIVAHLQQNVSIERIGSSAIRRISFRHPDRETALMVVRLLHEAAETHLREEARKQSAQYLSVLNQRQSQTDNVEQRRVLLEMTYAMERIQMMVNADLPFAADVLEHPSAAQIPDWPAPARILLLTMVLGAGGPLCVASLRHAAHLEAQRHRVRPLRPE